MENGDLEEVLIDGYVREPKVLKILDLPRSTFWAEVAAGRFPRPTRLTRRTIAWRRSVIRDLCEKLAQESNSTKDLE